MTQFVRTRVREQYGKQSVIVDACYPYDEGIGWSRVAPLTEQMAHALVGLDPQKVTRNSFLNKGYVVYAVDYDCVYAVYLHDFNFSIIACDVGAFEHRRPGDPDHPMRRVVENAGYGEPVTVTPIIEGGTTL